MKSLHALALSSLLLSGLLSPAMAQVTETTETTTTTTSTTPAPYTPPVSNSTVTQTSETTSVRYVNDYSAQPTTGSLREDIKNAKQRLKDHKDQMEAAKSSGNEDEAKRLKHLVKEDKKLLMRLSSTSSGMDHLN